MPPVSLADFDLTYTYESNLHEVANSPTEMAAACEFLASQLRDENMQPPERAKLLGELGVHNRILGRLEQARGCLEQAVEIATRSGNRRQALANNLRLAHVYQWQRDFEKADSLFAYCLRECETDPELKDYEDFACQHYGKSLFDQARFSEAEAMFHQALEIRVTKGDPDLIESTSLALKATKKRVRNQAL